MPVGLKEKKGRLGTFARKHSENSDSGANPNATAPKNEPEVQKRSEAPQVASHGPTRQELAEAARLPVPTGPRYVAASSHQQNGHMASQQQLRSPPRIAQTSPTPRRAGKHSDDHRDLFSGSQLGENFMQSGLSTPQSEPQDVDEEPTPNARRQSIRASQHYIKDADRAFPSNDAAAFKMGDDGMMSVVAPGTKRRTLPLLMDGFQDDAMIDEKRHSSNYVADRNYPSFAVPPQSLPVRQVRVQNRPAPSQKIMHTSREVGSPSPSVESALWQGQRKGDEPRQAIPDHESVEELASISGYEEARVVSDLQNVRDAKRPAARGGSMHANMAQYRPPKDRKRHRGSADYDDKILNCMTYQDLQNEPFDMDPARTTGQNGHDAFSKLPLKLEQYRQQGAKEQHHMFSTMSMDEWETSGDWFVDQFTDIMTRLRDARRSKRRMIQGFENEAAAREEAVRLRSETIDRKLAKMRQDGQRVVEDKSL
ncbi:Uncharacterized protein TPAR_07514 [Tolypocladium paradoxum]|uniref:Extracellular mutant protein 11 C-terminal domain-containing protein n=1 Tax=Tolypocladium paradoxum TaxID=94208 RepID=A0A2S4KQ29_9HYPO|nr:Uncharacterized protein TPAR_07514 [Tolypocladium paradoxum]